MNKLYSHPTNTVNNKHKNPVTQQVLEQTGTECQIAIMRIRQQKLVHAIGSHRFRVLSGVKGVVPSISESGDN